MGKNKTIIKGVTSHEVEKRLSEDVVKPVKEEVTEIGKGFFEQIVGFSLGNKTNSPEANQKAPDKPFLVKTPDGQIEVFHASKVKKENVLLQKKSEKAPGMEIRGAIDYSTDVLKNSERAIEREMYEINRRMREIIAELQRLVSSSKMLKTEFADVAIEQAPAQAGEYHLNFFDWLLITIQAARQKVEDSGAWLNAVKKKKNKGYWGMSKKHGTTFSLSNERSIATQAG